MDHENFIAVDELFYGGAGLGRIAAVILVNNLDLTSVDAALRIDLVVDRDRAVIDRIAVHAGRSGQRAEHADLDGGGGHAGLGERRACCAGKNSHRDGRFANVMHDGRHASLPCSRFDAALPVEILIDNVIQPPYAGQRGA